MADIDFSNIQECLDYVNQYLIENHNNEIQAIEHNNIETGLVKFIIRAARNWDKAVVRVSAGNYTPASVYESILIFRVNATGTITLADNIYNEWTVVNITASAKQLIGSISSFVSASGILTNNIAAKSAITIAKGEDNKWYQVSGTSGSGLTGITQVPLQFIIGDIDSPMSEGDSTLIITQAKLIEDSVSIVLDSATLFRNFDDQISYGVVWDNEAGTVTINFNQSVKNGQKYMIGYAYTT